MATHVSRSVIERALALAAADPEVEACGLLLGRNGEVEALLPAANVAADPRTAFEIDPATLLAAHRAARGGGPAVLGCFHSHPNGIAHPSIADAAAAQPGQLWLIVGAGTARLFRFGVKDFADLPCLAAGATP